MVPIQMTDICSCDIFKDFLLTQFVHELCNIIDINIKLNT